MFPRYVIVYACACTFRLQHGFNIAEIKKFREQQDTLIPIGGTLRTMKATAVKHIPSVKSATRFNAFGGSFYSHARVPTRTHDIKPEMFLQFSCVFLYLPSRSSLPSCTASSSHDDRKFPSKNDPPSTFLYEENFSGSVHMNA